MKHNYEIIFSPTRTHSQRAIADLVKAFSHARMLGPTSAACDDAQAMRALFAEAERRGFRCSLNVWTQYGYDDALAGDLGLLHCASDTMAERVLPKDAFEFSSACPRCGLGAVQAKPHVLSERAIRYKGNFLDGHRGSLRVLMRSEIGRQVAEATGQPWCMRHPVTRSGEPVKEWMEAVPCATMPPLSPRSEGVLWGSTTANSHTGDPPEVIPPCPVCGRNAWAESRDHPTRLVYPRAAIEAAQKHAVVSMYEPEDGFPEFDPAKRTFKHLFGLPRLLFNRAAIKVLMQYIQTEHVRTMMYIQPVFSE